MNFFFPDNWLAKIATLKKDSQICHNQNIQSMYLNNLYIYQTFSNFKKGVFSLFTKNAYFCAHSASHKCIVGLFLVISIFRHAAMLRHYDFLFTQRNPDLLFFYQLNLANKTASKARNLGYVR